MKKHFKPTLLLLFTCLLPAIFWGQISTTYKLHFKGISTLENTQILALKHPIRFNSKKKLLKTKDSILQALKERGYMALTQDSLTYSKNEFTAYINLGQKIDVAHLRIAPRDTLLIKTLNITRAGDELIIPIPKIKQTLQHIQNILLNRGELFAKVHLSQITNTSKKLTATLSIERRKKRTIDNFIIKGYPKFPKSFLKHYFQSNTKQHITPATLQELSQKSKQLAFVIERKAPELLFTKDSTIAYLFLAQKKDNSFDGLVNFSTENEKIQFRGAIDLKLNNAFHRGEQLHMNWISNNKKQELNLTATTPYIYNTKITPSVTFNLYKNDSLYNNAKATLNVAHPMSQNISVHAVAAKETSSTNKTASNAQSFQKTSFGLGFLYNSRNQRVKVNTTLTQHTRRTANQRVTYQFDAIIHATLRLSNKLSLAINNITKLTTNNSDLENELFRSGGKKSIRGYPENSILSNSLTLVNTELILQVSQKASIFSIQDLGLFQILEHNELLSSLGLGYRFQRNNNLFNVAYLVNTSKQQKGFSSPVIAIKIITLF